MVSLLPMLWPFAPEVARPNIALRRGRTTSWLMGVFGLSLTILLLGAYSPPSTDTDPAALSEAAGVEFLGELEKFRGSPLARDADLSRMAGEWARAMSEAGLGHSDLSPLLKRWNFVGENVGMGASVGEIFVALVESSSHRANMEDARFTHLGVGVFVDDEGILWTTHLFAGGEGDTFRTPAGGP